MKHMTIPIRALVVDDSPFMRKLIASILSEDDDIEVVGLAADPLVAREMIKTLNPDVITLDVEMPLMDGVTFLRKIMELRPTPVVMVSSLTQSGADTTLEALEIGAIDFVAKPASLSALELLAPELIAKVKAAGRMQFRPRGLPVRHAHRKPLERRSDKIVAIGASTGGVEALKVVLTNLPADMPAVVITQHMPERFTEAFARRLNAECLMEVCEASHNQPVVRGTAYIAPGGRHLTVARAANGLVCRLDDGELVSGHRPSVDVLFSSVAESVGAKAVGVILTGMGRDGAEGLLKMRNTGCLTLGQDQETSLVYGMPRAAFQVGAVARQHALADLPDEIITACLTGSVAA